MIRWMVDQILLVFNFVPELIMPKDDPRFDFLRWWLGFVLIVLCLIIIGMVSSAIRPTKPPNNSR